MALDLSHDDVVPALPVFSRLACVAGFYELFQIRDSHRLFGRTILLFVDIEPQALFEIVEKRTAD